MPAPTPQPPPLPANWPVYVDRKGPEVNVSQLSQNLVRFLDLIGLLHIKLFNLPLIVTSGNDPGHVPQSKHYRNLAVDVRSWDKDPAGQLIFAALLSYLAPKYNVAIFDERARDSRPHFHIEEAD